MTTTIIDLSEYRRALQASRQHEQPTPEECAAVRAGLFEIAQELAAQVDSRMDVLLAGWEGVYPAGIYAQMVEGHRRQKESGATARDMYAKLLTDPAYSKYAET